MFINFYSVKIIGRGKILIKQVIKRIILFKILFHRSMPGRETMPQGHLPYLATIGFKSGGLDLLSLPRLCLSRRLRVLGRASRAPSLTEPFPESDPGRATSAPLFLIVMPDMRRRHSAFPQVPRSPPYAGAPSLKDVFLKTSGILNGVGQHRLLPSHSCLIRGGVMVPFRRFQGTFLIPSPLNDIIMIN